jgi:Polyketide cyclase / dehydrase and lipid transport
MSQLSTQVQIKAPADKLWEVLVDLDSLPQWIPDNASSETASQNSETMTNAQYYDATPFHNQRNVLPSGRRATITLMRSKTLVLSSLPTTASLCIGLAKGKQCSPKRWTFR